MRFSQYFMRLGAVVALGCIAAAGCEIHTYDDGDWLYLTPEPPVTQQVTIDADAELQVDPGNGVGVFIQYATGGHWYVFTSCDSLTPSNPEGSPCAFDVFATPVDARASIRDVHGQDLAGHDTVERLVDGTVHLSTENTDGLNGMSFDLDSGAAVELDVYLDGIEDPHYIYWVGDGVLHTGAPSNPLILVPNETTATSE